MLRILVVDDSKYQRFLVKRALQGRGECDEAEDGRQAVAMFQTALDKGWPYHLVVMDLLMPVMDGLTAVRAINALQRGRVLQGEERAKVIVLTSVDDPDKMMEAQFKEGADSFIIKPFDDEVLVEALMSLGLAPNPLDEISEGAWE